MINQNTCASLHNDLPLTISLGQNYFKIPDLSWYLKELIEQRHPKIIRSLFFCCANKRLFRAYNGLVHSLHRAPLDIFIRLFEQAMDYEFSDQEHNNFALETDKVVLSFNLLKVCIESDKFEQFTIIFDAIFDDLCEDPCTEDSDQRPYSQPYLINTMIKYAIAYDKERFLKYLLEDVVGILQCTNSNILKEIIKTINRICIKAHRISTTSKTSCYLNKLVIQLKRMPQNSTYISL